MIDYDELIEEAEAHFGQTAGYSFGNRVKEALKAAKAQQEAQGFDVLEHLRDGYEKEAYSECGDLRVRYFGSERKLYVYVHGEWRSIDTEVLIHFKDWQPYVEEPPKTKPSINGKWSDFLPDGYDWIAVDCNGIALAHTSKPSPDYGEWHTLGKAIRIDQFPWFNRGDCPWDESLVCRDETEEA